VLYYILKHLGADMNVYKVYSGKRGCMCGCKGKYSYTAKGAVENGPGYDVTNSINERSVKIITTKVFNHPDKVVEDDMAYVEQNGRIMVAFFAE
jgi:uncharacterized protein YhfF